MMIKVRRQKTKNVLPERTQKADNSRQKAKDRKLMK